MEEIKMIVQMSTKEMHTMDFNNLVFLAASKTNLPLPHYACEQSGDDEKRYFVDNYAAKINYETNEVELTYKAIQ